MSVLDALDVHVAQRGGAVAFRFLPDGDVDGPQATLTFAALDVKARGVAAGLRSQGLEGERVLLLFPPGLDFVVAFLACLRAGVVAVPAPPPDAGRLRHALPRLRAIAQDSGARAVLTTAALASLEGAAVALEPSLGEMHWLAMEALQAAPAAALRPRALGELAFLQYTSGSTAAPRGVQVTHGNLLHNSQAIQRVGQSGPRSVAVSWLPSTHDMGLIGGIIQPLFVGFCSVLLPSMSFLRRPARWLRAISHFRGTDSAFPCFALDLCVRRVVDGERAALDLSSWRTAWVGAEPVRHESLERFSQAFAGAGFRREALLPVYGLAESTLLVTGAGALRTKGVHRDALAQHRVVAAAGGERTATLVGCGEPAGGAEVAIVSPQTGLAAGPDEVGEIWVRSPSVAQGYWGRAAEAFDGWLGAEGPYLRTGDLGFLDEGQLFVTGRIKDLLILRGANHYPQDIEQAVERALPHVRPGSVAAVTLEGEQAEQLGVVVELREPLDAAGQRALVLRVREAVAEALGLVAQTVALVPPGTLQRTSSGKLQRFLCRDALAAGTLPSLCLDALPPPRPSPSSLPEPRP